MSVSEHDNLKKVKEILNSHIMSVAPQLAALTDEEMLARYEDEIKPAFEKVRWEYNFVRTQLAGRGKLKVDDLLSQATTNGIPAQSPTRKTKKKTKKKEKWERVVDKFVGLGMTRSAAIKHAREMGVMIP